MKAEHYIPILEDAGIRPTSTRLLIYDAIYKKSDTFSLTSLEDELQSIDKSVIFRTLSLFHERHLIHSVDDGSGLHKYCLCHNHGHCSSEEAHCHFFCEKCRKTYCLSEDSIPPVHIPEGFIANKTNYIVKGICAQCAKKHPNI
ncbi:transcriptional repressor [Bacteroides gallinaceum]|uniref:Fur family transcriptional regulator n=1 Tax=Bacteroides gallinaceum TaxID=1462571 RepID=UPI0025A38307|nr:transcriptional repressor [Bacteroides gallinaceum]MDM8207871.1 transcriptional repressor [Bacteroides gallinaceum]